MRGRAAGVAPSLALSLALASPGAGLASGFSILQQAPTSAGRSFAGDAAIGRDASTAFFNPAALARLRGSEAMAHVTLISPNIRYRDFGVSAASPGSGGAAVDAGGGSSADPADLAVGGGAFLATRAGERLWFGLSLTAPFGLALNYDEGWFGRYDSVDTELLTVNVSPVVAYDVVPGVFAVGGGLDIQYADIALSRAVPNPLAPGGPSPATDGGLRVEGDGVALGFNLGAHLTLGDTRLGAHYRSGMRHSLDGDATVAGLSGPLAGLNGASDATTRFDLPGVLSLGAAQEIPSLRARALAEVRLYDWSAFDTLRLDAGNDALDQSNPYDFRDSFIVSVGGEWDATPALTLRSGLTYDRTPTIDRLRNTSLPDGDRVWIGVGATYAFSDRFEADFAANGAIFRDGTVDRTDPSFPGTPLEGATRTRGVASLDFLTVSAGLRYRF